MAGFFHDLGAMAIVEVRNEIAKRQETGQLLLKEQAETLCRSTIEANLGEDVAAVKNWLDLYPELISVRTRPDETVLERLRRAMVEKALSTWSDDLYADLAAQYADRNIPDALNQIDIGIAWLAEIENKTGATVDFEVDHWLVEHAKIFIMDADSDRAKSLPADFKKLALKRLAREADSIAWAIHWQQGVPELQGMKNDLHVGLKEVADMLRLIDLGALPLDQIGA